MKFIFYILFVITILVSFNCQQKKDELVNDDLTLFLSKYGEPDQIKSSEYEKPRPQIITKQLIYKKENVRAVYIPDAPAGTSPPYKKWNLLGFQDNQTNKALSPEEVVRRLEKRQKN